MNPDPDLPPSPRPDPGFAEERSLPKSRWSLIRSLGSTSHERYEEAWNWLANHYWGPVFGVAYRRLQNVDDARDLAQAFFERLLQVRDKVANVDSGERRFRKYVFESLHHFLVDAWRKARAMKRGGGRPHVALEEVVHQEDPGLAAPDTSPMRLFDRDWARLVFDRAFARLRQEKEEEGRADWFETLGPLLVGARPDSDYETLAADLSTSVDAVKGWVKRLKKRYKAILIEEVGPTVDTDPREPHSDALILAELRYLHSALNSVDEPPR